VKKIFIGGLTSSGTTIIYDTILSLGLCCSTDPYREGQKDPLCPKFGTSYRFDELKKKEINTWIQSYTEGRDEEFFLEKSPGHFKSFGALNDMYKDEAYFIMVQRDPCQRLFSTIKRWGKESKRAGSGKFSIGKDLYQSVVNLHEIQFELNNFMYIKYEDFCDNPKEELKSILQFLDKEIEEAVIEGIVRDLKIKRRKPNKGYLLTKDCKIMHDDIRKIWGYK
jgi:hypothetical protein